MIRRKGRRLADGRLVNGWPGGNERGVALIAVLWFVVAAAGLSLTLVRHGQADLVQSHGQLDAVEARALLDAGVARGVAELMRSVDRRTPPATLTLTLEGSQIAIRIESESGKIDLNAADPVLITSLARTLALPEDRAVALGKAVAARRGAALRQRPLDRRPVDTGGGAAARTVANPFRNVDEIRYLSAVDDSLYQAVVPYLTVYTGLPQPQSRLAGEVVRKALELRRTASGATASGRGSQGSAQAGSADAPTAGTDAAAAADPSAAYSATTAAAVGRALAAPGTAPGAAAPPAKGEINQDPKGIYSLVVQVQLPGGYVSAARTVVWLARPVPPTERGPLPPAGGVAPMRPYRVLDWTPIVSPAPPGGGA